jgi:zinc protease
MLNRTIQPELGALEKISVPAPASQILPGEIPFLSVNGGTQDILRIELIFSAGNIHAFPPLLATAANDLLDEGTTNHTSVELAEKLDQYGAFLETECGADWASVTLYTLSKFLGNTLPLLTEIVTAPAYESNELSTYATQGKQRMLVNQQKVDYLARRNFAAALFGESNSYGYLSKPEDYDLLERIELQEFFDRFYSGGLFGVFVSGKFTDVEEAKIKEAIVACNFKHGNREPVLNDFPADGSKVYVQKDAAIQSAIRIGRKLFNRTHPDFFRFSVLNTILGGYFGSRLMSNIREDKGYTYGIGSGLISQKDNGYFFISTEVGAEVCQPAVKEIYAEVARLREDLVPSGELDLVKKYLWGSFQRSIDGPLALSDRHKSLLINGLGHDYYEQYMHTLKTVTPEEIRDCARRWLQEADLTEVIVGP